MQNLLELGGYKRALILIVLGLCVVAALPPIYIWPLAFVGLSGLFLFLDRCQNKKSAFLTGWYFGIGFFGGGLYWLTNAFLVDAAKHGWLIPIAVPGLAVSIGLFIGLTTLLTYLLWRNQRENHQALGRIIIFCVTWVFMEWVRSWLFTGFPWNMIATIWGFSDDILQTTAYVGPFGLSFFTLLATTLSGLFFYVSGKKRLIALGCALLIPALMWSIGYMRLLDTDDAYHDKIILRLIQPNIDQATKWKSEYRIKNFETQLNLSTAAGDPNMRPTHIIWPETAVTFALNREPNVLKALSTVVPSGGLVLTGTPRMTPRKQSPFQVWNSLMAVDEFGAIQANYDKSHLVPFGEYIPLRAYNPIPKLTDGLVDFTPGTGRQTVQVGSLPSFSPLICYEIIFPNHVIDDTNRPEWLLNITNDGWYGNSPGPYQHLLSARLRSIEEGMPLVRVANTGVSIITDSYGRIQASLPYGQRGFLDVKLHKALPTPPITARLRSLLWIALLLAFFALGQSLLSKRALPSYNS
ncbi:MAG: apolipoprotein N-acyltransferase [Methylocystaceae bacterium]|nr:apolipoprotein N-acyltransferase [Methylocystaceae bacterium]